jgi:hypothetical protein
MYTQATQKAPHTGNDALLAILGSMRAQRRLYEIFTLLMAKSAEFRPASRSGRSETMEFRPYSQN